MNNILQDITLHIIDREGKSHIVHAPTDMNMNIMEVIRMYELAPEGTIGICGGMSMCASCQCYIANNVVLPEKSDEEEAMLWEAFNVNSTSRLSCQIQLNAAIDGLEIVIAPEY